METNSICGFHLWNPDLEVIDIAAVAVQALTKSNEHRNKVYNITGPEAISNYEIAEILSNIAKKKITYVDVSDNDARRRMKNSGMQEWTVESLMELFGFQKDQPRKYKSLYPEVQEECFIQKPITIKDLADTIESVGGFTCIPSHPFTGRCHKFKLRWIY